VPHGRLDGLAAPVVGIGLTKSGIDFDAPDGEPAQVIFLVLTPKNDTGPNWTSSPTLSAPLQICRYATVRWRWRATRSSWRF